MSGTSRMSIFATAAMRQDRLAARARCSPPTSPSMLIVGCDTSRTSDSCHDSSSIHRWTPSAFFVAASLRFGIAVSRIRFSSGDERPHLVEEALDRGRVPVGLDERVAAPARDATPGCRCCAARLECTSAVGPRPHFSPLDTSSSSTMPLAPRLISTAPSRLLVAERDDHADAFLQRGLDLGLEDDLREVRRADLLLALAHEHEVHRELLARGLERMQRGEQRHLRSLGVRRAAADHDLADAGPIDDAAPRAAASSTRPDRTASRRT